MRETFPYRLRSASHISLNEDTLAVAGLAAWTAMAVYATLKDPTIWLTDMFGFIQRAQTLSLANVSAWVDGLYPFGYPLLLRLAFNVVHDYELAGRLISLVAALVGLWLLYRLAHTFFEAPVALLVLAFALVNPTYLRYATASGTDMVTMVVMLAAVYVLCRPGTERYAKWLALSGLLLGLAYLLRYTALVLAPCLIVWLLLPTQAEPQPLQRRVRGALVFTGAFLVGAAPQLILSAIVTHNPFYNDQARNIDFGMFGHWNWGLYWPETSGVTSLSQVVLGHPGVFIQNWAANTLTFLQMNLAQFPLNLLFFAGLVIALKWGPKDRRLWLLAGLYFVYGLAIATAFVADRLLLLDVPLALLFAGYGFYRVMAELLQGDSPAYRAARYGLTALLVLVMLGLYVRPDLSLDGYDRVKMQVSNVLNQSGLRSSQEVLSFSFDYYNLRAPTKDRFAIGDWYSTEFVPYQSVADIAARMQAEGQRFLVFDMYAPDNVTGLDAIWHLDQSQLEAHYVLLGKFGYGAEVWQLKQ